MATPFKLSQRELRTINNYMNGMSKKEAMEKAGYSDWYSLKCTDRVFNRPEVAGEIERRQKLAAKRADVSLDWIIERLKSIADANVGDLLDVYSDGSAKVNMNKITPELRRALTNVVVDEYTEGRGEGAQKVKRVRISVADKLRALELLVKHLGLSKEKIVVEGEIDLVERLQRGRKRVGEHVEE